MVNINISLNILRTRLENGLTLDEALDHPLVQQNIDTPELQQIKREYSTSKPAQSKTTVKNNRSYKVSVRIPLNLYEILKSRGGNLSALIVTVLEKEVNNV